MRLVDLCSKYHVTIRGSVEQPPSQLVISFPFTQLVYCEHASGGAAVFSQHPTAFMLVLNIHIRRKSAQATGLAVDHYQPP